MRNIVESTLKEKVTWSIHMEPKCFQLPGTIYLFDPKSSDNRISSIKNADIPTCTRMRGKMLNKREYDATATNTAEPADWSIRYRFSV